MSALHIVQGGIENGDRDWLVKAARKGWSASHWTAPKTAAVGDEVVIFIGGIGFFATGEVTSTPRPDRSRPGRYSAGVTSIRLIDPPISLSAIIRAIPGLTWTVYPRSYTTPSNKIANKIRKLIADRRATRLPSVDLQSLQDANLEELRRLALLGARAKIPGKSTKTIYRVRSAAIHRYVLSRADGACEGCGRQAPFRNGKGIPYLEPHHTTRLSDEGPDHPARVIALCPNCHRRAHYSQDCADFNASLKKKLGRLERMWREKRR